MELKRPFLRLSILSFLKGSFFLLPLLGVVVPYALPLWLCLTALGGFGLAYHDRAVLKPSLQERLKTLGGFFKKTTHQRRKMSYLLILLVVLGCFVLWMGASVLWAPHPLKSLRLFGSLTALFACGGGLCFLMHLLPKDSVKSLMPPMLTGTLVTLVFLGIDILMKGSLRHMFKTGSYVTLDWLQGILPYNQGSTFLAVIIWPLLGLCYRFQKYLVAGLVIVVPLLLTQLESHTAVLGLILGLLVFLGVYTFRRPALILGGILVFAIFLTSPHLTLTFLDPVDIERVLPEQAKSSYSHRLWIWRYVSHRALERPLIGWGLDASRDRDLKQSMLWHSDRFCLEAGQKHDLMSCANESIPLHPHNMALQIWLELGIIGSILASFLMILFPLLIAYAPVSRFGKALAASTYASALTVGFIAYGVWQNWWVATFLIGIALTGWLFKVERKTLS